MSMDNIKYLWLLVLISCIYLSNARQIRYSRYNTEVTEGGREGRSGVDEDSVASVADNQTTNNDETEIQATVREIKLAPYPASGFRPSKAFPLPNESGNGSGRSVADNEESVNESVTDELTTSLPETLALTTTTPGYDSETTTSIIAAVAGEEEEQNNVEIGDDDAVSENDTPKAPYPAAGYQPRIPFLLPNNNLYNDQEVEPKEDEENVTELSITEIPEEATTTAQPSDFEIKIKFQPQIPLIAAGRNLLDIFKNQQPEEDVKEAKEVEENTTDLSVTELPEENTTDLPEEIEVVKAPYPAAGYRPSKAFLLPTEQLKLEQTEEEKTKMEASPKEDNSKHPVCGSSTDPLAPKPLEGEKEDPNSESIYVNSQTQEKSQQQQTLIVPVRLTAPAPAVLIARPFVYTTHIQAW